MTTETTSYPLSGVPQPLWEAYSEITPNDRTVNDNLIQTIARHVAREADPDDLDDEAVQVLNLYLDGEMRALDGGGSQRRREVSDERQ